MKTGTTASPRRYEAGPASRPNRRMHIAHLARAENELLASAPSRHVRAWAPRPAAVSKIELENCVECASFPAPTPRDEGELHALARQVGCCVRRCDRGGGKSAPAGAGNWEYFAPQDQIVAIRAGHLFDSRSGNIQTNQVVLITADRITDVGSASAVQLPAGTRMLDLSSATVLGMIDTHVHVNTGGNTLAQRALRALANAQIDLDAGFTTVLDMDSRGSFYTVDLRDAINAGIVQGPRMQVVGQSINQRATNYYPDSQSVRYYDAFTEGKNVNSTWLARAAVREAKLHGVDYIKIYTTQDFAGTVHMWKPDGTLVPVADLGRGRSDRGRGAPAGIESGLPHLRGRRIDELPDCGGRRTQSPARTR
jgi:Amidohydrolase family